MFSQHQYIYIVVIRVPSVIIIVVIKPLRRPLPVISNKDLSNMVSVQACEVSGPSGSLIK